MNDQEKNAKHAQSIFLLAEAAVELAIENRHYRQICGNVVLPSIPSAPDVSQARAQLVELRQQLTDHPASPQIGEVLGRIAQSLRILRA